MGSARGQGQNPQPGAGGPLRRPKLTKLPTTDLSTVNLYYGFLTTRNPKKTDFRAIGARYDPETTALGRHFLRKMAVLKHKKASKKSLKTSAFQENSSGQGTPCGTP